MKKNLLTWVITLSILVVCVCLLPTKSQAAIESDLTFTLNSDGVSYSVSRCNTAARGELVIPESYNEKPVTRISSNAFSHCNNLTSITIPNSITNIGYGAFYCCKGLTSIAIPDSVTHIGEAAFQDCQGLTNAILGNAVTSIGHSAFKNCTSLTSVTLGNRITSIDDSLFYQCTNLKSITIPNSVTSIGYSAFYECTSLNSITIPNSVTIIDAYAFYDCSSLASIAIPNSVTRIKDYTFSGCSSLSSVVLGNRITSIGEWAFYSCDNLTIITIPASVSSIGEWAFYSCDNLTSVVLPKGIDQINDSAFSYCKALKKVYYRGTQVDWSNILIRSGNEALLNATIIYNFTGNLCNIHTYSAWTMVNSSTHKRICSACQNEETAYHKWNSGNVTRPATCKEAGVKTFVCTDCGGTKTETIEKLTTHIYNHACDTTCNICGGTRTVSHQYSSTWSTSKNEHWHECNICGDKKEFAAHAPSAAVTETTAQTCTTCGYIIKPALNHTHNYSNTLTINREGHWYACPGCSEQKDYAAHIYDKACDTNCNACGFVRTITHSFGPMTMQITGMPAPAVRKRTAIPLTLGKTVSAPYAVQLTPMPPNRQPHPLMVKCRQTLPPTRPANPPSLPVLIRKRAEITPS